MGRVLGRVSPENVLILKRRCIPQFSSTTFILRRMKRLFCQAQLFGSKRKRKCSNMGKYWDKLFGLDQTLSIWVEEEELGSQIAIYHKKKRYFVNMPNEINRRATIRLRGLGKTRFRKTGDLFLYVWLNRGEDVRKNLWLSETSARNGAERRLFTWERTITMIIPPNSYHGLTIRLRGLGRGPSYDRQAPNLDEENRGNLLVKLFVYPDEITPNYRPPGTLSTENMFLEGWVYRKFDEVIQKLGNSSLPTDPIQANTIANLFNTGGARSIFNVLVDHLGLGHLRIDLTISASIFLPGSCERTPVVQDNRLIGSNYRITLKEQFLDNPFCIAAIMAHELCHVVYSEKIDDTYKSAGYVIESANATLEMERTVDLLVFMFKMGEFQLRVARNINLTLGYFNQEVFERIQVIVSRKLDSY